MRRRLGSWRTNASTTSGSNWSADSAMISATAESHATGFRYGRSLVIASSVSATAKDVVGDPDLADVVQEEAVFGARLFEERRVDGARELGGVTKHAMRMCAG